jgi:hypothetical protein
MLLAMMRAVVAVSVSVRVVQVVMVVLLSD